MTDRTKNFTVEDVVADFPESHCKRDDPERRTYTVLRDVGSGVSGTAFLVNRTVDGKNLIAKVTDLSELSDKKKAYARSEVRCLAQCDHFAIIKHIDDFKTPDGKKLLRILELADAGDLGRQIKHRARSLSQTAGIALPELKVTTHFKEYEVAFLFLQVVLAVHDLHRKEILHRDITSANVFLMSSGIVKLGELGFSQICQDTVSTDVGRTFCGTPYYLAPELWRHHRYSKKADVWSLGVLLYEMAALKRPFSGTTWSKPDDLPDCYSLELCKLVTSILAVDPGERPATGDILRSKYMQYVMHSFERTIKSGSNSFSSAEKEYILQAVAEARESLKGPLMPVTPLPKGKQGGVLMCVPGGWQQRQLRFDGHVLTISADDTTVDSTRTLEVEGIQGIFPTNPTDVIGLSGCFTIVLDDERGTLVYFQTGSPQEAASWVQVLNIALEEHAAANASRASVTSRLATPSHPDEEPVTARHVVHPDHVDPSLAMPACVPAGGVKPVSLPTEAEVQEATVELQRLIASLSADAEYLLSAECDAEYDGIEQEIEALKSKISQSRDRLGDVRKVIKKFQGVQEPVVASDGYTYDKSDIQKHVADCKAAHVTPCSPQTGEEIRGVFYANKSLTRLLDALAPLVGDFDFFQHRRPMSATSKRPAPKPAGE